MDQITLETLLLPLTDGPISLPESGPINILRAEPSPVWRALPLEQLVCMTPMKPEQVALEAAGFNVLPPETEGPPQAPLTLVLPPRQKDEMRAVFARAMVAAPEGGIVLGCLPNKDGARSAEKALKELAGGVEVASKNKCRAFWAVKDANFNADIAAKWIAIDTPQIGAHGLMTRPGVFSWDRVDPGSELLADIIPEYTKGRGADLGSGLGYLSREVLAHCPDVEQMDLFEANYRAHACALENFKGEPRAALHYADATTGLPWREFDFAIMNPPFHTGKADNNSLGQAFIRSAANAVKLRGTLWLVANRHLPYERTLEDCFRTVDRVTDEGGYKILKAEKPKR